MKYVAQGPARGLNVKALAAKPHDLGSIPRSALWEEIRDSCKSLCDHMLAMTCPPLKQKEKRGTKYKTGGL